MELRSYGVKELSQLHWWRSHFFTFSPLGVKGVKPIALQLVIIDGVSLIGEVGLVGLV